ncbi:MAG: hypothetical protein Tsb0010_08180 [Parvularculaceae bacterium]
MDATGRSGRNWLYAVAIGGAGVLMACSQAEEDAGAPSLGPFFAVKAQAQDLDAESGAVFGDAAKIENAPKPYLVKSGMIEYELSGARSGVERLYWDDWGMRQAKFTSADMRVKDFAESENTLTLTLPDGVYFIDLSARTAAKIADRGESLFAGGRDNLEKLRNLGAVEAGVQKIAGKACEVWSVKHAASEQCLWMNLPLRTHTNAVGMTMSAIAVRVAAGEPVDPSIFELPEDIELIETQDAKALAKDFAGEPN